MRTVLEVLLTTALWWATLGAAFGLGWLAGTLGHGGPLRAIQRGWRRWDPINRALQRLWSRLD